MNKRICTLALALLTLLSTGLPALAQGVDPQDPTDPQEVEAFADAFFVAKMAAYHIPGAAFVLVKDGQILFAKGYGYADLENQTPVVPEETVFCAGSVGKLFTSTAVMQLAEQGLIDMDRNSVLNLNNCISRCAQVPGRCQTAEGDHRAR